MWLTRIVAGQMAISKITNPKKSEENHPASRHPNLYVNPNPRTRKSKPARNRPVLKTNDGGKIISSPRLKDFPLNAAVWIKAKSIVKTVSAGHGIDWITSPPWVTDS